MSAIVVVGALALGIAPLFAWGFRRLPAERWQILAVLPREQQSDGTWRGVNLTYYGLFNALAVAVGVALAMFLPATVGLPWSCLFGCVAALLAVVLPASRIVNRMVEGHWHGFTVGGAVFAGMLAGPWLILGVSRLILPPEEAISAVPLMLGAVIPAYALGEGVGRLACISFGCCYGRPLAACSVRLQKLFAGRSLIFKGRLKKAAYAHGLEGQPLIPVQALTAVISTLAGLAGIALFLAGRPSAASIVSMAATQLWRFLSEFLRADYRGAGRISAYQRMAAAGAVYIVLLVLLWPEVSQPKPDIARGLTMMWTPGTIIFIEAVAILVFIRMGVSTVTTSSVFMALSRDSAFGAPEFSDRNGTVEPEKESHRHGMAFRHLRRD